MIDPNILMESANEKGHEAGMLLYFFYNESVFKTVLSEEQFDKAGALLDKIGYVGYTLEEAPDDGRVGHFYNEGVDRANVAWEMAVSEGRDAAELLRGDKKMAVINRLIIKLVENEIISSEDSIKLTKSLEDKGFLLDVPLLNEDLRPLENSVK